MTGTGIIRRDFTKALRFIVLTIAITGCSGTLVAEAGRGTSDKPNIILFLSDDQGWVDTSLQLMEGRPDSKSNIYQTPRLEGLAAQGMRFSNAYHQRLNNYVCLGSYLARVC